MKELKLNVQINKRPNEVFAFVTDPANTPKWIDSIKEEQTNEWPPKLGTIYRNRGSDSEWSEYIVTELEPNQMFVMSQKNSSYHVKYTLMPSGNHATVLEYYEWVDEDELDEPFTQLILDKLKAVIEDLR